MLDELERAQRALLDECVRVNEEFEAARDALNVANEAYNVANRRKQRHDALLTATGEFLRFLKAVGKP